MTPRFLLIVRRRLAIGLVLTLAALAVAGTLRAEDAPDPGNGGPHGVALATEFLIECAMDNLISARR